MEAFHEVALRIIEETFKERLKRGPSREGERVHEGALPSVLPVNPEEVEFLAKVAERYSIRLVALGAETAYEPVAEQGSILVRFDLMRGLSLRGSEEVWVRAEPGAPWLELENNLSARGWGLAVYPTSAPRTTIGGWLALDGLGVGSFEYGWLRENVLSADVVLTGGERRTVRGEELRSVLSAQGGGGIVVATTLRTRRADADVPFAQAFASPEDLAGAVTSIFEAGAPLWHLAFLSPAMAHARGLGEDHLLFGAYPGERAATIEKTLRDVASSYRGRELPSADAYRVWGERFFPVAPSRPTPAPVERMLVPLAGIAQRLESDPSEAVQGTVARSGEVLMLAFDALEEGWRR
jgi:FAD/FMN-containing dehydrogenase